MRFVIAGAGGFAKEVIDLVETLGHEVVACYQEASSTPAHATHAIARVPVVSDLDDVAFDAAAVAIGHPESRARVLAVLAARTEVPALVHPSASVSPHATLGDGVLAMQNTVVNADATVEDGVIVNVGACVAHDCRVGACTHLAPGVQMGGGSSVGRDCEIGTNATLLPNTTVGDRCRVGAGAVVIRDIPADMTVVGVPARSVTPESGS